MSRVPKKKRFNWGVVATVFGGLFFLAIILGALFGPSMGGYHLGNFAFALILALLGFVITNNIAAEKIRSKVAYESGDADVFANEWTSLLCTLILGVIICILNSLTTSPIKYLLFAAIFIPFYFIYFNIQKEAELRLYAKYDKTKQGRKKAKK